MAIPALHTVRPLVDALGSYIRRSAANTALFSRLSANLQSHGFVEHFLSVLYYVSSALSRYDKTSHMLSILLLGPDNGQCGNYDSGRPIPACSAHYGSQGSYRPTAHRAASARRPAAARRSSAAAAHPGAKTTLPNASSLLSKPRRRVGKVLKKLLGRTRPTITTPAPPTNRNLQNLINYLLK